jgi:hypothetical protein
MGTEENQELAVEEMSEAAAEAVLAGEDPPDEESKEKAGNDVPPWASLPKNVKMPNKGCSVAFMRIPAAWTSDPSKGDRWCMCWQLGETDERLAYQRSRGDMQRSVSELAKATIRVIDGNKADWSGVSTKPGSVSEFWSAIGPKGRQVVRNYYVRTHTVSDEEALDFFSNHFVNVTVG